MAPIDNHFLKMIPKKQISVYVKPIESKKKSKSIHLKYFQIGFPLINKYNVLNSNKLSAYNPILISSFHSSSMTPNKNLTPEVQNYTKPKNYFVYAKYDFAYLRRMKSFFVDFTPAYAEILWNEHMLLLKAPRHGKSTFLQGLAILLDISISEVKLKEFFGDLAIFKDKDAMQHFRKYHVMELNFNLDKDDGYESIKQRFYDNLISTLKKFCDKYGLDESDINKGNPLQSLKDVSTQVANKGGSLIVIVDEYDRFANRLFLEPFEKGKDTLPEEAVKSYHDMVAGDPGVEGSSLLRSFLEKLKELDGVGFGINGGKLKTIIAGILPIAIADASGANVFEDISHRPIIVDSFGFKEEDIERALTEIGTTENERKKALKIMRTFFNGYNFFRSKKLLFNPQLCLRFLKNFHTDPVFKNIVLSWDLDKLSNGDKKDLNDVNSKVSGTFLSFLSLKGIQTKKIISALVWCRNQSSIVDGSNVEGNGVEIVYGIKCLKSKRGDQYLWGVHYDDSIEKKIRLNELLHSTEDLGLNNILFMMYTYGLITFADSNKKTLCITNEMMFDDFKEKFGQYLKRSTQKALTGFLSAKNSAFLEDLLTSLLESTSTPKDNSMSEGGIQLGFELALQNHLSQAQFNYKIKGSSPFQNKGSNTQDFEKTLDLYIEFQDSIFAIEFKRARPNSIKVEGRNGKVINGKFDIETNKYEWQGHHYSEQQEILSEMKKDDLTKIQFMGFAPEKKYGPNGQKLKMKEKCATIGDLLESAINQLTGYIKALNQYEGEKKKEKKVYAFAVIHMAQNIIIVKEHSFNGKQLKDSIY